MSFSKIDFDRIDALPKAEQAQALIDEILANKTTPEKTARALMGVGNCSESLANELVARAFDGWTSDVQVAA